MKHIISLRYLNLCLLLFCALSQTLAHWNNYIVNFHKNLYGNGSQIWQISTYGEGNWTYFANKNGLLQFDGSDWNIYTLNNKFDLRSVYCSTLQGKVFFGGIHEFGFIEPDRYGKLNYTCLSDSLDEADSHSGNIWNIFENDNIMYWQADDKVIKQVNCKFTAINVGCKIDCSALIDNTLYIGTTNGVEVLVGNTFYPIKNGERLNKVRIRGFIPYEKGALIATAYDGLFYYDGYQLTPFMTGVERFLRDNEVFSIAASNTKIALGTVHKGLVILEKGNLKAKYFNENNGLQNNTVLSLKFDPKGNLWAGLNDGIDYICLDSPFTSLYTYPNSFGAGYCSVLSDGKFYFGTNRGLYYTDYPIKLTDSPLQVEIVSHTSGQVWNLREIQGELFCMHDKGLFLISGNSARKIGNIGGVWDCKPLTAASNKLLVGTYAGIYLLEKEGSLWKMEKQLEGYYDSTENFEIEGGHTLWIHNNQDGIIKAELDTLAFKIKSLKKYKVGKESSSTKYSFVNNVDNKIYFSGVSGIHRYNKEQDLMEICPDMNKQVSGSRPYFRLFHCHRSIVALNEKELAITATDGDKVNRRLFSIEHYPIDMLKGFKELVTLSDSLIVIPNENGFALLKNSDKWNDDNRSDIHIKNIYVSYPKDSLIYSDNFLNNKYLPELPYKYRNIRIVYGLFSFTQYKEAKYRYRLEGKTEWSELTSTQTKEYSNLSEGRYTFQVEAVFPDGYVSGDEFTFIIRPPWYRSSIAYFGYTALFLAFMWFLYYWDKLRMAKKKRTAVLEKEAEMQLKEQEYQEGYARKEKQIMELENEKLEYRLKHKSQEMANLMINFMRKNEILTEIKQELYKVISKMSGEESLPTKKMLLILNNKIDSNMQSDDTLKRIEEEFDLVHNNFIKKLSEKHPDLSLSERMMCTYLKMNLSTKEIAPLLNLSTRGVETTRYRLRKKLGLEREDSLTAYLNNEI